MRPAKFDAMHLRDFEHRHRKYLDPLGIIVDRLSPPLSKAASMITESYDAPPTTVMLCNMCFVLLAVPS